MQTRLRGGGIFRILVRILLHSLLNDDLASRNMAARRLNELLMKYSPISLTDKSAVLFMRQRTEQRLLYIIGHVSEARKYATGGCCALFIILSSHRLLSSSANLTEITNETSETGDLLLGLITRWKDLVPGLTVVDDALVSNKSDVWTAAAEQLLTDGKFNGLSTVLN